MGGGENRGWDVELYRWWWPGEAASCLVRSHISSLNAPRPIRDHSLTAVLPTLHHAAELLLFCSYYTRDNMESSPAAGQTKRICEEIRGVEWRKWRGWDSGRSGRRGVD